MAKAIAVTGALVVSLSLPALVVSCGGTTNTHPASTPKDDAILAATEWIGLFDDGNYAETWAHSANLFRDAGSEQGWTNTAKAARKCVGHPASRDLETAKPETTLPGAPPGEYYVLTFTTVFDPGGTVPETVVVVHEEGEWRVTGYVIGIDCMAT